jgi:hypothetical protein
VSQPKRDRASRNLPRPPCAVAELLVFAVIVPDSIKFGRKKASVRGLFLKFSRLRMTNGGNRICTKPFFTENRQESGKSNKPEMRVFTDFK